MSFGKHAGSAPLDGLTVLDFSGLGPGPFATMMLADFGADVIAIRRPDPMPFDPSLAVSRGKATLGLDLRTPLGQATARRLVENADILVEGFRPGVMERLGLGPEQFVEANPGLIYARLTGWGQTGPYCQYAGHDINYLAISGVLGLSGIGKPTVPPGLLGDLANGSYLLTIGVLMALYERQLTGKGQVIDAAIVDGAAYMLNPSLGERNLGLWDGELEHSLIGGAAPFYGVFKCSDEKWFSVGAIEPKFYRSFLEILELTDSSTELGNQLKFTQWPALRERVAEAFLSKSSTEWADLFAAKDCCGMPVLTLDELVDDPHLASRKVVLKDEQGKITTAPAPRLSNHPALHHIDRKNEKFSVSDILARFEFSADEIDDLTSQGIVWPAPVETNSHD